MVTRRIHGLSVTEEGSGPALLFVAGLGGLGRYWRALMEALKEEFRVVTFDHRGLGASAPAPPPYTIDGWADDVLEIADALSLPRFTLVGHSTGGAIGQVFAARHPGRLDALALSGTWAQADHRMRELFALRRLVLEGLGAEAYGRLGTLLTRPLVWEDGMAPLPAPPVEAPAEVVLGRIDALLAHDATAQLAAIRAPTMVLAAADDQTVTPNLSRALAQGISGARFTLLAEGGHHFPLTRAGAFEAALRTLLADA